MFLKNILTKNFLSIKKEVTLFTQCQTFGFATKMRAGVTKNKKDSAGKRLGLKKYGGEEVRENQIILRQRGFKWKPGENVHFGKDQTLHASKEGVIKFTQDPWSRRRRVFVHVVEQEIPNRKLNPPLPFMYHPELYPELAKNNLTAEPLVINKDIKQKMKLEEAEMKKSLKSTNEITVIKEEENNQEEETFSKLVMKHLNTSNVLSKDDYTSKYEIEPILQEISQVGVQYLVPNFANQSEKYYEKVKKAYIYHKNGQNPFPESLYTTLDSEYKAEPKNITTIANPYSYFAEKYAKYINEDNQPIALRDLMVELKKEGKLNPRLDIREVPHTGSKSQEALLSSVFKRQSLIEEISTKIKNLTQQLESLATYTDEQVHQILHDYNFGTKEELAQFFNSRIDSLETELRRIEQFNQKKLQKVPIIDEKRKRELPGILKNAGILKKKDNKEGKSSNEGRKKVKIVKKIKH